MDALDAIFLDLDGCLVDSTLAITNSFDHALASVGIAPRPREVTRTFIGPPLRASFDRIVAEEGREPSLAGELVLRYRERYGAMAVRETAIFAGIPDALAALREIAPIAIVTSKLGIVAERLVDDIGLRAHVAVIHAPEDEHVIEPKQVTLARALAAARARPRVRAPSSAADTARRRATTSPRAARPASSARRAAATEAATRAAAAVRAAAAADADGPSRARPVEQAVLHGLGHVLGTHAGAPREVGDGARHAAHLVVRAGAQPQPLHRLAEERARRCIERHGLVEGPPAQVRVERRALACPLHGARRHHPGAQLVG